MRMIDAPPDLPVELFTPVNGPTVLQPTESETAYVQNVVNPFGLWRFRADIGASQYGMAREFKRLSIAALGGANCFRFPYYDPDEPRYDELGIDVVDVPSQNGTKWSDSEDYWDTGKGWEIGPPLAEFTENSAKDSGTVTIDATAWNGVLPTFIGVVGHFAMYALISQQWNGMVVTCRVWPPVRKAIVAGDYATMRPVLAVRLSTPQGAPWARNASALTGAALELTEVPQEVVDTSVTEDGP